MAVTEPSDDNAPLYAARTPIFPKDVKGWFRRFKWQVMAITLGIYYVTPWLRWDRGPHMPDQAVLVDLASRRFFFFWIEIWPTEFYYVAGMLIMAGLGLFLFTSILGRAWCGYACPQTVWTDLFLAVERWIDGDRNAQIRLWNRRWDAHKWRVRLTKYAIWLLIAVATGGAWVFYFTDAPRLAVGLVTGDAPFAAYACIALLTATTFTFGGFMREQICLYACPWPRIQAAMMDERTLTVTYRDWRGEPRGKARKTARAAGHTTAQTAGHAAGPAPKRGDCVDCNACVAVCPAGVDIREGMSLGCITCGLCIDACDDIMGRLGRPRGLIDYVSLEGGEAEQRGAAPKGMLASILRPRTIVYFTLWGSIGLAMLVVLALRDKVDLRVAHDRNPTFVTLSDGSVRNGYEVTVANRLPREQLFALTVEAEVPLEARLAVGEGMEFAVAPDRTGTVRLFLTAQPVQRAGGPVEVTLTVENLTTNERESRETIFVGLEEIGP
ncbi:MAG: cytochrome c oxidase accessory protein CcoG [Pseudomonadota bacterium]